TFCRAGAGGRGHHTAQPGFARPCWAHAIRFRMIAEAGAGRALPFYLIAVGAVFASVALIHAWVMFRPRLFHAGVDRSAFRMTAFFQGAMAIAFVGLGSWALWMHRPVDGTLFSIVVI